MDPASAISIAATALHCVRLLLNKVQCITDAPDDISAFKADLLSIETALQSLQALPEPQWKSIGENAVELLGKTIDLCTKSCEKFSAALGRWTRHSDDGKLSWRDRTVVGILKQGQIRSMSKQLQNCKLDLTMVVSIANLQSSSPQGQVSEETHTMLSTKETEVTRAIDTMDSQLAEITAEVGTLVLARKDHSETDADRTDAISQVTVEKDALDTSRKLLEELLVNIRAAAANSPSGHDKVNVRFGDHNRGAQTGINHGTVYNTFGNLA